ncbi:hypothetical protein RRG08_057893 [Elysia crispata]|uniref:Uncharacterized protein n=1 Tax=Elysia crispata TaxID=231223 RepID=A0AAE0Z0N2_9GAST|nr:hypothetical protein RRG08_057893 [Elysia crispata]
MRVFLAMYRQWVLLQHQEGARCFPSLRMSSILYTLASHENTLLNLWSGDAYRETWSTREEVQLSMARLCSCGNMSTVKVVFLVFLLGFLLNYLVFIHFRFHAPRTLYLGKTRVIYLL